MCLGVSLCVYVCLYVCACWHGGLRTEEVPVNAHCSPFQKETASVGFRLTVALTLNEREKGRLYCAHACVAI